MPDFTAFLFSPFVIPLGGMVMVWAIARARMKHRANEKEMEHREKMKAMEIELARLKAGQPAEPRTGA